ncbi:uncharacterized protein LOC117618041 [Prunus dulcis]|uniref:uncharacterized protein LOC117618041 n=1 Tax=Prunus dulcis TaxID=3755 RepID=UPI0014839BBA|nr:uncharacterized protein LOC117618041 [Prunus dulcis]
MMNLCKLPSSKKPDEVVADDWATRGGLVKTDWTQALFTASYRNFKVSTTTSTSTNSLTEQSAWQTQGLDAEVLDSLGVVKRLAVLVRGLEALFLGAEQQVPTPTVSVSDHSTAAAAASPGCGFDHVASGPQMRGFIKAQARFVRSRLNNPKL